MRREGTVPLSSFVFLPRWREARVYLTVVELLHPYVVRFSLSPSLHRCKSQLSVHLSRGE